jgi:hypothetical protein
VGGIIWCFILILNFYSKLRCQLLIGGYKNKVLSTSGYKLNSLQKHHYYKLKIIITLKKCLKHHFITTEGNFKKLFCKLQVRFLYFEMNTAVRTRCSSNNWQHQLHAKGNNNSLNSIKNVKAIKCSIDNGNILKKKKIHPHTFKYNNFLEDRVDGMHTNKRSITFSKKKKKKNKRSITFVIISFNFKKCQFGISIFLFLQFHPSIILREGC